MRVGKKISSPLAIGKCRAGQRLVFKDHRHRQSLGYALVFVLAMLVLILVVVLAFFSRAILHRQIGTTTSAQIKAQMLSQTAADLIIDDFEHEIEAGALPPNDPDARNPVRRPRTIVRQVNGEPTMVAPSIVPQLVTDGNAVNIVKISRAGRPFFTAGPGYETPAGRPATGPTRASAISTTKESANDRRMAREDWLRPQLLTASEGAAFVAPDWIYLNRRGGNPISFSPAELRDMASSQSGGGDFVIGRYAYVVYDTGGLIDINVAGNALPLTENARRGRMNQVSLTGGPGGLQISNFANFVQWRSPISSNRNTNIPGSNGLFDPKRSFVEVPTGDQAFVNRQDLLAYTETPGSPIPRATLPFLTMFSRDIDAPSYEPNSERPLAPSDPDPRAMNPPLLSVVFPDDNPATRPDSKIAPVRKGTPVMPRRFPLTKLRLFEEENPDPKEMAYYFGLTREASGNWSYTAAATSDSRIKRLGEVAAERREPNFFEVLQAVIYTGSVGQNGTDTYTAEKAEDEIQQLQILQIGANIIDQWDSDDVPTTIELASGTSSGQPPFQVYGTENLPYVSQIGLVGWRPADARDFFQVWAVFDVWNPHQNAKTPPVGIDQFRIIALEGSGRIDFRYTNDGTTFGQLFSIVQSLVPLNAGRSFTFSSTSDYSEPTTLGTAPQSRSDTPGLLMIECSPPPILNLWPGTGVKTHNSFRLRSIPQADGKHWKFAVQARDTDTGKWHTYQLFDEFARAQSDIATSPIGGEQNLPSNTHHAMPDAALVDQFYTWRSRGASTGMIKADPRTARFGFSGWSQARPTMPGNDFLGRSIRSTKDPLPNALLVDDRGGTTNNSLDWSFPGGIRSVGRTAPTALTQNFEVIPTFDVPTQKNRVQIGLYGLVSNNPDVLNADHPVRYSDPDGVIRPGDGYLGGHPTAPNEQAPRPLILNRPFRSVGDLGYVFRDIPWKTIDFATKFSGDLGLLDAFSLSEVDNDPPLVAGLININTRQVDSLAAALQGGSRQIGGINPALNEETLSANQARTIATAIVAESQSTPFLSRGDLVSRVFSKTGAAAPLAGDSLKTIRESAIRALAEIGTTRTWNFMIDLVTQTGKFTPNSKNGEDFLVQGESRVWIHVAIDRMTGEILEMRKESVNEN